MRSRLGLPPDVETDAELGGGLDVEQLPVPAAADDPAARLELAASGHPELLLRRGDLEALADRVPPPLQQAWREGLDSVQRVATEVLAWSVAPLSEPGLLARLTVGRHADPRLQGDDLDPDAVRRAAEDYASRVNSPVQIVVADLDALVTTMHRPTQGASAATIRAGLGDTLAALVPATVIGHDATVPGGLAAVRAGACLLGWFEVEPTAAGLVAILRDQAWRLITAARVAGALASFAKRPDDSHTEWFVHQLYTDEDLTRSLRALLRSGRPATDLPRFLRALAAAAGDVPDFAGRVSAALASL